MLKVMFVFRTMFVKQISTTRISKCYKEAVETLNSLQTNAQVLQTLKLNKALGQENNVEGTKKYLLRSGVTLAELNNDLSIIHVSGTKGKGSTCAICESILHSHGYKTGFFSSPHLVAVRERIRINKMPLSEVEFTRYFWKVYKMLDSLKEHDNDMPAYFKFLTVMALNVFLTEKVDVAIIEVGIGGEYDCTNIFSQTAVVGITSLGLDHTNLLGNTIEQIATQKGGIMKPGSLAFTSPQPASARSVLHQCAMARGCSLWEVPPLSDYKREGGQVTVGLSGNIQALNASLALQLAHAWMNRDKIDKSSTGLLGFAKPFEIDQVTAEGLEQCAWPGRYQIITKKTINGTCTFYLDGAHTAESVQLCTQWFLQATNAIDSREKLRHTLVFNVTGDRDLVELLTPLVSCNFETTFFCPNVLGNSNRSDLNNHMVSSKQQLDRCEALHRVWQQLTVSSPGLKPREAHVLSSVSEVLQSLEHWPGQQAVLVTGSLHLVGNVLSLLLLDRNCSYLS